MRHRALFSRAAVGTTAVLTSLLLTGCAWRGDASPPPPPEPVTFAVIGDVPYGQKDLASFPKLIRAINRDPDVSLVIHLGDIRGAESPCDDAYFGKVREDFNRFEDPLFYTPGDNEWTDCHRKDLGSHDPLERLATIRSMFFGPAGAELIEPQKATSQEDLGVPENRTWTSGAVSFATLHVVGSNNDLNPWSGRGTATTEQSRDARDRLDAAIDNLRAAFLAARVNESRAIVLAQQADIFNGDTLRASGFDESPFRPLAQAMIDEASVFDGPVFLFNGDSHRFKEDQPLAAGSPWLKHYGLRGSTANLRRITVDGSDLGLTTWLKVNENPDLEEVLSFERVPLGPPPASSSPSPDS